MTEKTDKIFFNSFYESDYDGSRSSFNVDDFHKIDSHDNKMDEEAVYNEIMQHFQTNNQLKKYLTTNEAGEYPKISKIELNEIYNYFRENIDKIYLIEVFSSLIDILDLNHSKFYESLSNLYKDELIQLLRTRGYLKKQYRLF